MAVIGDKNDSGKKKKTITKLLLLEEGGFG